jgi:hypothetical protein
VATDHAAEKVLLRTVRGVSGSLDIVPECEPTSDYGRRRGERPHKTDVAARPRPAPAKTSP